MNDNTNYTRTAIALHWAVALLIFFGWSIGLRVSDLPPSPDKLRYLNVHKWIGVTIFALVVIRSAWRLAHPAPELPVKMPEWQKMLADVSHSLLYALMLVIPVSGWMMSSAKGYQTVWFGVLPLPDVLSKNEALGGFLDEVHILLAWTLAGVVAVHVAAAFKHHFIDHDTVLRRMLPVLAAIALLGAADARISASDSQVSATFRQSGVSVDAPFRNFSGTVSFDAQNLAASGAKLEVQTASLDLGDPAYNDEVRKPAWFDSAKYPNAAFVSTKVVAAGAGRYVASGTLNLKGRSAPLDVTFTAQPGQGRRSTYAGEFPLSRKAFGIGDAQWNDVLEDAVIVKFRIVSIHP